MPDCETHIGKYRHNKNFVKFGINSSKDEKFDDWEITGLFYASVHLVEAVLYKQYSKDSKTHEDRMKNIIDHPAVFNKSCVKNYIALKSLAWTARYDGIIKPDPHDTLAAQTCLENIEGELLSYIK